MAGPQSITGLVRRNAVARGDAPALIFEDESYTWADVMRDVSRRTSEFLAAGVREEHAVALYMPSSAEYVLTLLTLWRLGVMTVPLNTRLPSGQVTPLAARAKVSLVLSHEVIPDSPALVSGPERFRGTHHASLSSGDEWNPNRAAACVYTSGSTGESKGVLLSLRNLLASAERANSALPFEADDTWLLSLPLYHVSGLGILSRWLVAGATMEIAKDGETMHDAFNRLAPSHCSLVATQLYRLFHEGHADTLARMKVVLLGGGHIPEDLVRDAVAHGVPVRTSYGMTETASLITCAERGARLAHLMASGTVMEPGTVRISEDGEICVAGDSVFQGYLMPDGTRTKPFTADGWFETGDLGHFDDAGYLHVTGRKDNRFISGGENIQPEEIEKAFRAMDGVEDAVVVPKDDEEFGQRPVAFVKMREGTPDGDGLRAALRDVIASYKIPDEVRPWPAGLGETGIKPRREDFRVD